MPKTDSKNDVEESNRMWASAAFVGVLFIIGVPLWWKTTEVYRVALPYDEISSFKIDSNVIKTELTILANDEPTASELADTIEQAFEASEIIKLKINRGVLSDSLRHTLDTAADDSDALDMVSEAIDLGHPNHFHLVQRRPLYRDAWVSTERVAFFRDASASHTIISLLKTWIFNTKELKGAATPRASDVARQTRVSPAQSYRIVLTAAGAWGVKFDAAAAVEDYVGSFVDELSVLHNFTLKSQWLHMLDFDFQAKKVKDSSELGYYYAVRQGHLHSLLTRIEGRAATQASDLPTINLVLYAVSCDVSPLVIVGNDDMPVQSPVQAFLSPKWGGVYLASPPPSACMSPETQDWEPQTRVVMGTLIAQLRELLGIVDTESIESAHLEVLRSVLPRRWELDNLLRIRTLEQLTSAQLTLQSLAQLLGEISNIVINDEVGASITDAVADIKAASGALAAGQLLEAYRKSQAAFVAAEAAFTDPSLLALLYFPDDQKYAIYIPLFLPILFPVLLTLKNLFYWFIRKQKKVKTE